MNEQLLRHAADTIWCNPGQDRQFTYRLARLTPRYGVRNNIVLAYERLTLPTQHEHYHVYQIGYVIPRGLGIPNITRRWMTLKELAEDHRIMSDIHVDSGLQFPRFDTHVWITPSRNLIVAVKINPLIHDLDDHALYLRLYSNAYFQSSRSEGRRHVFVRGLKVTSITELLIFQNNVKRLVDENEGAPYYFVNGRMRHNVSIVTAQVGDVVEFVLDGSIKRVVEFDINELPTFTSTLDSEHKYILHYDDPSVTTIEYLDDVDVYLINPTDGVRYSGVLYHRTEGTWLRMLTHKDYSIPVERLKAFVNTHPLDLRHQANPDKFSKDEWISLSGMRLRLYIRHSGYERPLQPNANRIQELYRLSSDRIVRAMTGTDATLDLWRAENLEQCPYVRFMSADDEVVYPITFNMPDRTSPGKEAAQTFVGDVFGYHAAASILAATPSSVYTESGVRFADMAYEHRADATVFEYDAEGVLLEWHYHTQGSQYQVRNSDAVKVEALSGYGGDRHHTVFGTGDPVEIPYGHNHRVYVKQYWNGKPTGDWRDITDSETLSDWGFLDTQASPTRWVWTADPAEWYGAVRIDDLFLCREFNISGQYGHHHFRVQAYEDHGDGPYLADMELPVGQLDVYLNNRPLIEGIDYVVNWPDVVISNLEYLVPGEIQHVLVRGYGFCRSDLTRLQEQETGFLRYGVLSQDHQYDLHTNKVLRVVVDGHYRDPADLVFDEERNAFVVDDERNGAPYTILAPPVVFHDVYDDDRAARREDDERERNVSDYMTAYFPPRVRDNPDGIVTPYHVISAFSNNILHDLVDGIFDPEGIEGHYGEHDIRQWCKGYEWLLPYDLAQTEYDDIHIKIYPHWFDGPQELDLFKYNFFKRVLKTYLRYPPDIAAFVSVK